MTSILKKGDPNLLKHPKKDDVESATWYLPINIFPTSPNQIYQNDPIMKMQLK